MMKTAMWWTVMLGLWANAAAAGAYSVMGGSCQVDSNGCASSTNYPNNYPDNDQCTMACVGCPPGTVIQVVDFFTLGSDVLTIAGQSYSGTMNPGNSALNLPGAPAGALQWQAGPSSMGITGRKWKICPVAGPSTTSTITSTRTSTGTTEPGIVTMAPVVANVVSTSTSNPTVMMYDGCSFVGQTCSSDSSSPYQRCGMTMIGSLGCLFVPLYSSCAGKKEGDTCDEVPYKSGDSMMWYSGGTCSKSAQGDCFFYNLGACGALQCNGAQQSSLSRAVTLGLGLGLGLSALAYILVSGGYLLFVKNSLYKMRWIPPANLNLQPGPSGYAREMIVETF